jgi:hypothetical protein
MMPLHSFEAWLFNNDVSMRSAFFWDITQRRKGDHLLTFRDNVSVPSSSSKKNGLLDP